MTEITQVDDVLATASEWARAGRQVALATVIETWGSSPRPVGSQLLVDRAGAFVGSVSGGCIEGAVVREAQGVIDNGEPKLLEFGVSDQMAWDVGLACGGKIRLFVERVDA
jgi:xanthine/CO dehydrogenase XdhC/CoxF family maturation factor